MKSLCSNLLSFHLLTLLSFINSVSHHVVTFVIFAFICYLIVMCAADVRILELRINEILWQPKRWLDSKYLKMAPEKTEALLVTDRRSFQYPKIVLGEHVQRGVVLRIFSAYRTVSTRAVLILASVPSIELLAEERKKIFQLRKELTCLTNLQEIARAKGSIRKDGRRRLVEK